MKEENKKILSNIKNNRNEFHKEMNRLNTKEEWNAFIEKWFRLSKWKEKHYEKVFDDLEKRKPLVKDGFTWYPTSRPFEILDELYYEYDQVLWEKMKRLEPERYKYLWERKDMGRACSHCEIIVPSILPKDCPICGRKLTPASIRSD